MDPDTWYSDPDFLGKKSLSYLASCFVGYSTHDPLDPFDPNF